MQRNLAKQIDTKNRRAYCMTCNKRADFLRWCALNRMPMGCWLCCRLIKYLFTVFAYSSLSHCGHPECRCSRWRRRRQRLAQATYINEWAWMQNSDFDRTSIEHIAIILLSCLFFPLRIITVCNDFEVEKRKKTHFCLEFAACMLSLFDALVRWFAFLLVFSVALVVEAANRIRVQCKSNRGSFPIHLFLNGRYAFSFSSPCSRLCHFNKSTGARVQTRALRFYSLGVLLGILVFSLHLYRNGDLWPHIEQNIYLKIKLLVERKTEAAWQEEINDTHRWPTPFSQATIFALSSILTNTRN